jgi:hypothetical protein
MRLRRVPVPIMEAAFVILLCSDIRDRKTIPDYTDFPRMITQICTVASAKF